MRREDWRDEERDRLQRLRDRDGRLDDYGQADYSDLYGYDPERRSGYRAYDDGRHDGWDNHPGERRSYADRPPYDRDSRYVEERPHRDREVGGLEDRRRRRDGRPSDRVLWAVIMERLEDERRLDLSEVEVDVRNGEVFLDGTVRHKADKRRIEDVADIEGVRNVQNNLRLRERRRWTFL